MTQPPAKPWSRLKPLPVIFVVGLFAVLWWRRPVEVPTPTSAPAGARAETGEAVAAEPGELRQAIVEQRDGEAVVLLAGASMGTRWNATVVQASDEAGAAKLGAAVQAALDAVDAAMSTYRDDSDLARLSRAKAGEVVTVTDATAEVLALALEVGAQSDGAFDVTVANLVRAWGFGSRAPAAPPTPEALAALRIDVGQHLLEFDRGQRRVAKQRDGVAIDLSAVAKGYAVDRAAAALVALGANRLMVEVGGEVATRGQAPGGRLWRLGIERPDAAPGTVLETVELADEALATSGDYRNFRLVDGRRVSHTVDPRTGAPVTHALASVSVRAATCAAADAWATALNVLGPAAGMTVADKHGLAAYFVVRRDDGTLDPRASAAWLRAVDATRRRGEAPADAGGL